jgi:hypothetical protein
MKTGDPRRSIQERYAGKQAYLDKIDQAAHELEREGFVLEADLPALHERAGREWDFRMNAK